MTTEKAHVLHLIWALQRGGAELLLLNLVRHADQTRFRHSVCCMGPDGPLRPLFENEGCPVYVLGRKSRRHSLPMMWRGVRLIRNARPDLIHLHRSGTDIWGQLIGGFAGHGRVIVTEHSVFIDERHLDRPPSRLKTWIRSRLQRMVFRTIAISEAVRSDLDRRGLMQAERILVIHNGVDTEVFHAADRPPTADAPPVIGSAGRFVPRKGFHVILEALALLRDRGYNVHAALAGAGPEAAKLEQLASDLGLRDRVRFAGESCDVPAFLSGLDIFVLSSTREGFGVSLVEAMACGLPVVASRVDGIPEIVQHERNGLLVPPADPGALTDALERYLQNPAWARDLGAAARQTVVERFRIAAMTSSYEQVYTEALKA